MSRQTHNVHELRTTPLPTGTLTPVMIRAAAPRDAGQISSLYRAAYAAQHSADAREHYPFPQFMDPRRVQQLAASQTMCWVVAEIENNVVGTIGAVHNIGRPDDRVVEYFGLVVNEMWRGNGIARSLFAALHKKLATSAHFMIAETRTADAGGWRTAKTHGFVPLGFEPFAHNTPAGSEPMLLLGNIPKQAREQRDVRGYSSAAVHTLARTVLQTLYLEPLPALERPTYPLGPQPFYELLSKLTPTHPGLKVSSLSLGKTDHVFHVLDDETVAIQLQQQWRSFSPHLSGVVGLNRLEGEDPTGDRYTKKCFVGYIGRCPVSCARIVWDHRDRRARILYLQTRFHGLQGLMVAEILRFLETQSRYTPVSVVIDVRADDPSLHATLEKLGFFPTVYYPCLVAGEDVRLDAVQYTRLYNCPLEESLQFVRHLDWPEANTVVKTVMSIEKGVTHRWIERRDGPVATMRSSHT
ncbi:MAG: GNAT family N-acetyltransferase [Alphaproteobacteria bacterium]|nr:GNAT family N-acetyltransferase [Alphaproteobacteria bacterium]